MSAEKPKKVKVRKVIRPSKTFLDKNSMFILGVLVVTALIFRLYRLGFLTLWVDEYMHATAAMKGNFTHGENNGVLLTWLNTSLAFVFGHSEFVLRFPVALFGAALLPMLFFWAKKMFDYRVAWVATILAFASVYLLFWSRVDRPYGLVPFFYVWLIFNFWNSMEEDADQKVKLNRKYLLLGLLAFLLSMLSQLICFLFIFSAGFYGTFMSIDRWIRKKSSFKKPDFYNVLFYLNVILIVFMFTPFGTKVARPLVELFLPKAVVQFIMPDMNNIIAILKGDQWDKCFNTYLGVLKNDIKFLEYLGWAGFVFAFMRSRRHGYFLISMFAVPFFLMSFVFTSTSHAKYMIQLYPVFILAAAYSLYHIAFVLLQFLGKKTFTAENKTYVIVCNIAFLLFVGATYQKEEFKTVLTTKKHGNLVNTALSEVSYVNWKQPCLFLKDSFREGDVVMATQQLAVRYYLEMDSVVWFRQMKLNPKWNLNAKDEDKYISMGDDKRKLSASTYERLVQTYNENPRGWLLADYYLDNALTDPRAKQFVEENFVYHYQACDDGAVKVFSWDKAKPKTYNSAFVVELGKNPANQNQLASQPFNFQFTQAYTAQTLKMVLLTQGIDGNSEAYVFINDKSVAIPSNGHPDRIETNVVNVPASHFKPGENKIQFYYNNNEANGDFTPGFVIYNMMVSDQ